MDGNIHDLLEDWRQTTADRDKRFTDWLELSRDRLIQALKPTESDKLDVYYMRGEIQMRKTPYKLHLINFALQNGLIDSACIFTMNGCEPQDQLYERTVNFIPFALDSRSISRADGYRKQGEISKRATFQPKHIIIGQGNYSQIGRMADSVEDWCERMMLIVNEGTYQVNPCRALFMLDEGDTMDPGAGDYSLSPAKRDENLHRLIIQLRDTYPLIWQPLPLWKISATLESAILDHETNMRDYYEAVNSDSIFHLPVAIDYIGPNTATTNKWGMEFVIDDPLEQVDKKTQAGLVDNLHDSIDVLTIAMELIDSTFTPERNPHEVPQVANVVMPRSKSGHTNLANVLNEYFNEEDYNSIVLTDDLSPLTSHHEIAVLVHNGDTSDRQHLPLREKIRQIGINGNGNTKLVVIVSKDMAGRAITIDHGDYNRMYDPSDPLFGLYCNISVLMPYATENIEQTLQAMRSAGTRPPIKEHRIITTPVIKRLIEQDYYNLANAIEEAIKDRDYDSEFITALDPFGNRGIGKGDVNKRLNRTTQRAWIPISQKAYDEAQAIGNTCDLRLQVPKNVYQQLHEADDRNLFMSELTEAGFKPLTDRFKVLHNIQNSRQTGPQHDTFHMATTMAREDTHIFTLIDTYGKYWIYGLNDYRQYELPIVRYRLTRDFYTMEVQWRPVRFVRNAGQSVITTNSTIETGIEM